MQLRELTIPSTAIAGPFGLNPTPERDRTGTIGIASPPFREWRWAPLSYRLAGPNFIELPDGMLIAGSRGFGKRTSDAHVMLYHMHETGLDPLLKLPGGGSDCGYPGFVWHDDVLWVTYNSTHEGRTNIYLARVAFRETSTANSLAD